MTFEEDFPSLKPAGAVPRLIGGSFDADVKIMDVYWKSDIRENCLDKQKVREYFERKVRELEKPCELQEDREYNNGLIKNIWDYMGELGL